MVRHDAKARLNPQGGGSAAACCACPTGESPVPVGVGAPGSRPQVVEGDLCARAGRQKPVKRREPFSGEQARGPQHEVKPAASTDLQPAGRAAHVTAKATSPERDPKREGDCGGVWSAARVQGQVRNVRGPSARPKSGQACSYKPKAKSRSAQRESEGIVVCAGQRVVQEGSSPSGARMRGVISERGGNASWAGERKEGMERPKRARRRKPDTAKADLQPPHSRFPGGQGVHREVGSEGHEEKCRVVVEGAIR